MSDLPSWLASEFVQILMQRIKQWSDVSSPNFLPINQRVAVFDLDGTLWCEKPYLAEAVFLRDEFHQALAEPKHSHHHLSIRQLLQEGEQWTSHTLHRWLDCYRAINPNMENSAYQQRVREWATQATHPQLGLKYSQLVYVPMRELITWLQSYQFECYLCSGSTTEFVKALSQPLFGVSDTHVLGSKLDLTLSHVDIELNIGHNKVQNLQDLLTARPKVALGNTTADAEMLRWVGQDKNAICGLINHDDAKREFVYSFDPLLSLELENGRINSYIVSMKRHWGSIFEG